MFQIGMHLTALHILLVYTIMIIDSNWATQMCETLCSHMTMAHVENAHSKQCDHNYYVMCHRVCLGTSSHIISQHKLNK